MSTIATEIGRLSRTEQEQLPLGPARRHYKQVLEVAERARTEFYTAIQAKDATPRADLARLGNAFAWANRNLWLAAQAVCDLENLPEDGHDDGIKWEVTL